MSGILSALLAGGKNKAGAPTFTPAGSASSNVDVDIVCPDATAHIFWDRGASPPDPTHTGDTATGSTTRIGSNTGTVNSGAGTKVIKAICYVPSSEDSDVQSGDYGP